MDRKNLKPHFGVKTNANTTDSFKVIHILRLEKLKEDVCVGIGPYVTSNAYVFRVF